MKAGQPVVFLRLPSSLSIFAATPSCERREFDRQGAPSLTESLRNNGPIDLHFRNCFAFSLFSTTYTMPHASEVKP
jgi:hypothetical protein